jgi:hypothetical protein
MRSGQSDAARRAWNAWMSRMSGCSTIAHLRAHACTRGTRWLHARARVTVSVGHVWNGRSCALSDCIGLYRACAGGRFQICARSVRKRHGVWISVGGTDLEVQPLNRARLGRVVYAEGSLDQRQLEKQRCAPPSTKRARPGRSKRAGPCRGGQCEVSTRLVTPGPYSAV